MTDDHTVTDAVGAQVVGKSNCLDAWRGFFTQFADYRDHFTEGTSRGHDVIAVGFSTSSVAALDGPALWVAEVRDGRLARWRVYEDTPAVHAELGMHVRSGSSDA